jgi:hypothetical protein
MSIYYLAWQDGDSTAVTADGQRLYFAGLRGGVPEFTTDKSKAAAVGDDSSLARALHGLDLAQGDDMD